MDKETSRDEPFIEVAEAHRAVGRYVVEFSQMVFAMQARMVRQLEYHGVPEDLSWIPFGGVTAKDITDQFFGMARTITAHDEADDAIATRLKTLVLEEVRRRNDVAHGEWLPIGFSIGDAAPFPLGAVRVKPDRKAGIFDLVSADLDKHSDAVEGLREMLWDYSTACFSPRNGRVSDVLRLEGKKGKQRVLGRVPRPQ